MQGRACKSFQKPRLVTPSPGLECHCASVPVAPVIAPVCSQREGGQLWDGHSLVAPAQREGGWEAPGLRHSIREHLCPQSHGFNATVVLQQKCPLRHKPEFPLEGPHNARALITVTTAEPTRISPFRLSEHDHQTDRPGRGEGQSCGEGEEGWEQRPGPSSPAVQGAQGVQNVPLG